MAGGFYNDTCGDSSNPVYTAYRDWMDKSQDQCWPARPSWDPLTVYAAIVGTAEAQMYEEFGTDEIDELGNETWDRSNTSNNEVNLKFLDADKKQEVTDILSEIVCKGNGNGKESQTFLQMLLASTLEVPLPQFL